MAHHILSARELQHSDIESIAQYWSQSSADHLVNMGVDLSKLPSREAFVDMLSVQLALPLEKRQSYCTIWEMDGKPAGHCNLNRIEFSHSAYMHLHLWHAGSRFAGYGSILVRRSLPFFFDRLDLTELFCEPNAHNLAPNRVLEKAGFDFVKEYTTVPGAINFEQAVKCWHMSREKYGTLCEAGGQPIAPS